MCGCVGDYSFGEEALNALREERMDVVHVRKITGVATGTAVILVIDGDNRSVLDKGANARLTKADIDRMLQTAQAGDIYLTQLKNPIDVIGYGMQKAARKISLHKNTASRYYGCGGYVVWGVGC